MAKGVKIFGKKLAAARNGLYLTQAALGEKLDRMSDENIGRIERSEIAGIAKKHIPKLAVIFGMTLTEFEDRFVVKEDQSSAPSLPEWARKYKTLPEAQEALAAAWVDPKVKKAAKKR